MTFKDLYNALDNRFPKELRCEWDNDGIMCASDLFRDVEKILFTLDVTYDAVRYAIENGFDTIISHHPLIFKPQKSMSNENYTQKKLIALIKNDVRVMSFHTRLDAADGGVNDTIANMIEHSKKENDPLDPVGRIITLKNKASLKDFAETVKEIFNSPCVLYSGNNDVSKIYILGGDGKDYIENAIIAGADTLLTGRASYNTMIDAADMGINIVEAGHFYTEDPVCKTLENIIKNMDPDIKTEYFYSNKISVLK